MRRDVQFYSEGCRIAGDLYLPDGASAGPRPGIVLCHGFAGVKGLILPKYAEVFAGRGFACLAFDYRGFGQSEGPRGRLVPREQIADIRNALTFMRALEELDAERIGLWGTSFGGANAISAAAEDARARCVVAQLTFGNGERVVTGEMSGEEAAKLRGLLAKGWEREVVRNKPLLMAPDQILTDPDSKAFFAKAVAEFPDVGSRLSVLTIRHVIEYKPEESIGRIAPRAVLVIAAERDAGCPPRESEELFARAGEPKRLVTLAGARHYDVYEGEHFATSSTLAAEWFERYLA
jgi:fermentation-respiration switch protein FrsA (DUF1100 family)